MSNFTREGRLFGVCVYVCVCVCAYVFAWCGGGYLGLLNKDCCKHASITGMAGTVDSAAVAVTGQSTQAEGAGGGEP